MKPYCLLSLALTILFVSNVDASTIGPELITDPYFDDPASWDVGVGSSIIDNGHLVVINESGFIFPDPQITTTIGESYQYSLVVDYVNNTSGGGKITIGGQTIWEPSYDVGLFSGTIVATNTGGLVFNFLDPYVGRAEFDSASIKAILPAPIPPALWLFGSGLLVLIRVAWMRVA